MLVAVPMLATAAPALAGATTRATTAPPPGASLGAPAAPDQMSGVAIPVAGSTAGQAALAYAQTHHRGTGAFTVLSESADAVGSVVRLGQSVNGIPVLGGQLIVRLSGLAGSYVVRGATDATAAISATLPPATWDPRGPIGCWGSSHSAVIPVSASPPQAAIWWSSRSGRACSRGI